MRYQPQELYLGPKGHQAIEGRTITIVGIGGVGSSVAEALIRAGVNLRLVDKERIYEHELQRLSIFDQDHIDKFKAKEAKKVLEKINPQTKVKTFHEELVQTNTFLLDGDIVIDCTNDIKASQLINKACKKPLLVCWYAGDQGLIFWKGPKYNADKLAKEKEHLGTIKTKGIFRPTVDLATGIVLAEGFKALLKKPLTKGTITLNAMTLKVGVKN
jgi:molybdopterin/thiamine biosynthesis adenylyltransferase